jgi:hypothetical protein
MGVSVKGTPNASATTSVTLPTHAVGDLIVLYCYDNGATTVPGTPTAGGTVPTWTTIDGPTGANFNASKTVYAVATATNHTSGTWTNTNNMIAVVLTGQAGSPIGAHNETGSTGTNGATTSNVTVSVSDGSSALLYFYAIRNVSAWAAAPTGYTQQVATASSGGVCLDTKNLTTGDGSATQTATNTVSGYRTAVVEILAAPAADFFAMF